MKSFANLLENLAFSPKRNVKLAHLTHWLKQTDGDSRGYGVAAVTGDLSLPHVKGRMIRELAQSTIDETLFALSYDFVGDLAETVSLLWPDNDVTDEDASFGAIVNSLLVANRKEAYTIMRGLLDRIDQTQRWALLKTATGGLRVGVSARLMRVAISQAFDKPVEDIEEIWPLIEPPYTDLFDWLEGRAVKPDATGKAVFKPLMLAHPLEEADKERYQLDEFQIEWKWDGARVQLVSAEEGVRLFSRSGDDISSSFPELTTPLSWRGAIDGELLAGSPSMLGSFNDLQQRLNRKKPSRKLQEDIPVFMRCYDILLKDYDDKRSLPLAERRILLEEEINKLPPERFDLSQTITAKDWPHLMALRQECRGDSLIEGVMLKDKNAPYQVGRIKGQWFKWKRDPLQADLVVLYAQRGHGRRSSYYSDYTFGAWMDKDGSPTLVPVAKAYSGFTDQELKRLDKFVREHTINKFGPVREVEPKLVVEIAFDSIHKSARHKSGVAMRFPRFHAIRWDKDPEEADRLSTLEKLLS